MEHKWGRTVAEINGSWGANPPTLNKPIPATLASRILDFGWSGYYLLNYIEGPFVAVMHFNVVTQLWEVAQTAAPAGPGTHFPYGFHVEADAPV